MGREYSGSPLLATEKHTQLWKRTADILCSPSKIPELIPILKVKQMLCPLEKHLSGKKKKQNPDKLRKTNHPHKRSQRARADKTLPGITLRNQPQLPAGAQHAAVLAVSLQSKTQTRGSHTWSG